MTRSRCLQCTEHLNGKDGTGAMTQQAKRLAVKAHILSSIPRMDDRRSPNSCKPFLTFTAGLWQCSHTHIHTHANKQM